MTKRRREDGRIVRKGNDTGGEGGRKKERVRDEKKVSKEEGREDKQ